MSRFAKDFCSSLIVIVYVAEVAVVVFAPSLVARSYAVAAIALSSVLWGRSMTSTKTTWADRIADIRGLVAGKEPGLNPTTDASNVTDTEILYLYGLMLANISANAIQRHAESRATKQADKSEADQLAKFAKR